LRTRVGDGAGFDCVPLAQDSREGAQDSGKGALGRSDSGLGTYMEAVVSGGADRTARVRTTVEIKCAKALLDLVGGSIMPTGRLERRFEESVGD